jgi:plasmid stability protein
MPSLTLKDIPLSVMERLRARAVADQRSLNREAIWLLEQALDASVGPDVQLGEEREAQLAAWRTLAGRWQGSDAETDELIDDIYAARTGGREIVF